jgi:hypothetical protein
MNIDHGDNSRGTLIDSLLDALSAAAGRAAGAGALGPDAAGGAATCEFAGAWGDAG